MNSENFRLFSKNEARSGESPELTGSKHAAFPYLCRAPDMKKIHIVLLVLIIAAIAVLANFLQVSSTYDTIATAKEKPGKFVHVVAKLDRSQPVVYDPVNNPNYVSFRAIDSLGGTMQVVYKNAKPENLEHSERLVLKGSMKEDYFECREILMKCPSKYTDDPNRIQESMNTNTN